MRGVVLRVGDTGELRSTHHAATTTVEGSGAVDVCRVDRELLDRVATQRVEAKKQHCHMQTRRRGSRRLRGELVNRGKEKGIFLFGGLLSLMSRSRLLLLKYAFAPRPSVSSRQRSPTLRALSIRSLRRELLEFLIQC